MDGTLAALQRVDKALSRPMQFISLPAPIERVIGFPNGELIFDAQWLFFTIPLILAACQVIFGSTNLFPAGMTVLGFALAVTILTKLFVFKRQRPDPDVLKTPARSIDVRTRARKLGDMDSFPSGCALTGSAMGCFWYSWTGSPIYLLIIPSCCFVRVYFVCHWLGDTIGGALIGAGVVQLLLKATSGDLKSIGFTNPYFWSAVPILALGMTKMRKLFGKKKKGKA